MSEQSNVRVWSCPHAGCNYLSNVASDIKGHRKMHAQLRKYPIQRPTPAGRIMDEDRQDALAADTVSGNLANAMQVLGPMLDRDLPREARRDLQQVYRRLHYALMALRGLRERFDDWTPSTDMPDDELLKLVSQTI